MKSCVFVVCKTMFTIGESQATSHANRTANTKTPNCQSSQGTDMTPKNPLDICANIAVTKHVLLADEFVPYRPRLLSFHSLHVNAMKCIYVGFSLSKLLSFFWKISLNSRLIRLEGFNNKISTHQFVCSTWPSGKAAARFIEGPGFDSNCNLFLASFLFFSSFFTSSFRLVFILGITVLLCFYI